MKLVEYAKLLGIDLVQSDDVPEVSDLRIVEVKPPMLENLDEGTEIMDVSLKLSETCVFSFDKHMDAIVESETSARQENAERFGKLNMAQENSREFDRRYKERPLNRIRVKK